ncbi:MAG: GNAT family N-acetyltransferase [Armatimonadota bacterium]|nr:GNAT family N-acetyltransferase [Armatimonadota bacterium]
MIIPIAADDYPRHWQDFRAIVQDIFPMLLYTPAQTEGFLNHWQTLRDDHSVFIIETRSGQAFVLRVGWDIQYLIPSDWGRRYDILREALEEFRAEFLRSDAEKFSLDINDGFPSHTLYYAGMLPLLGFEIHSGEITLQADATLLNGLTLPALPSGMTEVKGERERLAEYAALYAEAHATHEHRPPEQEKWRNSLGDAVQHEDMRNTWVGLEVNGKIVASCYGGCRPERWGNFLSVEELAVRPEFFGNGLGQYVLIRCLQELQRHYGVPGRPFQIGTWRHMGPRPLRLYLGLGFQVTKAETYSTLWNRPNVTL